MSSLLVSHLALVRSSRTTTIFMFFVVGEDTNHGGANKKSAGG
ncbi:MAG TPA: hypothetical protein VL093_06775 [Flavipsychrobacter sp.]|nr:hypothetical protein [Flavipsychrobacter sp.]